MTHLGPSLAPRARVLRGPSIPALFAFALEAGTNFTGSTWSDCRGGTHTVTATQATPGKQFTVVTDSRGTCLRKDDIDDGMLIPDAPSLRVSSTGYTVVIVAAVTEAATDHPLLVKAVTATGFYVYPLDYLAPNQNAFYVGRDAAYQDDYRVTDSTPSNDGLVNVWFCEFDPVNSLIKLQLNDDPIRTAALPATTLATETSPIGIGIYSDGTYHPTMADFFAIYSGQGVLSATERASFRRYLEPIAKRGLSGQPRWIGAGDSLLYANGQDYSGGPNIHGRSDLPTQLRQAFGTRVSRVVNTGAGGRRTIDIINAFAAEVAPWIRAGRVGNAKDRVFFNTVSNDIVSGPASDGATLPRYTITQMTDNCITYANLVISAGGIPDYIEPLPRNDGYLAPAYGGTGTDYSFETQRQQFIADARARLKPIIEAAGGVYIQNTTNTKISVYGANNTDPTAHLYYQAWNVDYTHLNSAGYTVERDEIVLPAYAGRF